MTGFAPPVYVGLVALALVIWLLGRTRRELELSLFGALLLIVLGALGISQGVESTTIATSNQSVYNTTNQNITEWRNTTQTQTSGLGRTVSNPLTSILFLFGLALLIREMVDVLAGRPGGR